MRTESREWRESCDLAQEGVVQPCHSARSRRIHPRKKRIPKAAAVYILASRRHGTLYTGVTGNLAQRLYQHRQHLLAGFTARYGVTRLVWYLQGEDMAAAIALEKKIKNRGRSWKVALIEKENPDWSDLAAGWIDEIAPVIPRAVAESMLAGVDPATARRMTKACG